jgi:hypothetical protein
MSKSKKVHFSVTFFDTFFIFFNKNFFVILVFFSNFDCKCTGNGPKNVKSFFMNVS